MKKILSLIFVVLISILIGIYIGSSFAKSLPTNKNETEVSKSSFPSSSQNSNRDESNDDEIGKGRRNAITNAIEKISKSVVGINVVEVREYVDPFSQFFGDDPFFRQFFGNRNFKQEVKGLGSGFLISADGYILTNDHVVGNASKIEVVLTNGKKYNAKLIGTDLVSDVALLKVEDESLPFVKLGNSDDVIIGEWVIALGNPFGLFEISDNPTVTVGVVSAINMNLREQQGRYYRGMIQTDASINSGNSGGPLTNSLGEVIGINSVIYTPNQGSVGLGFAIPINRVKSIVNELKKKGKIEREFWTGLDVQSNDSRIAHYFGLDKTDGVIVTDVKQNSPASRSGFEVGDLILEVEGDEIKNEEDLQSVFIDAKIDQTFEIKIYRNKKTLTLSLKIEKRT